jgi:hypothetical protein
MPPVFFISLCPTVAIHAAKFFFQSKQVFSYQAAVAAHGVFLSNTSQPTAKPSDIQLGNTPLFCFHACHHCLITPMQPYGASFLLKHHHTGTANKFFLKKFLLLYPSAGYAKPYC